MRHLIALICLLIAMAPAAMAQTVTASDPTDLSVTIYRDPNRNGGTMQLGALGGFALITETRRVTLPAGRAQLRFVGVVDGIIPESAIVSGLPGGVIEKNRDAALLSPAALLKAVSGKTVMLERTSRETGKKVSVPAQVLSANDEGVIFQTAQGEEAYQCTGMAERFSYGLDTSGLSARPVLSVTTNSARGLTAVVKLTYLAQGFDWNASYTGALDNEAKALKLGGWITLANSNSISLPDAQVQIVAGGLKREAWRRLVDGSPRVAARCWPSQRSHQVPRKAERPYELVRPYEELAIDEGYDSAADLVVTGSRVSRRSREFSTPLAMLAAPAPPPPPPPPPPPEQLGDLKLYRLTYRTTVAARQMKQTRLVEKEEVGVERVYTHTFSPGVGRETINPLAILRSRNDKDHGLGLPLPAGSFVIDQAQDGRAMLLGQPALRDTAEDEMIELGLSTASDITVMRRRIKSDKKSEDQELTITNAGPAPAQLELRYATWGTVRLEKADAQLGKEDGQPIFKLDLPPNSTKVITYKVRYRD